MFRAARAVLLSMRASEDFVCAEKLSAAEQVKPDCRCTPAVVSIFTDSAACVLSFYAPPLHYIEAECSCGLITCSLCPVNMSDGMFGLMRVKVNVD